MTNTQRNLSITTLAPLLNFMKDENTNFSDIAEQLKTTCDILPHMMSEDNLIFLNDVKNCLYLLQQLRDVFQNIEAGNA